jgi:glycosyltransferase involved in cell wall biosynthesis
VRIAIVGAFPFPLPQGSQVYCAEQAGGLRAAGAEVELLVYGSGAGALPAAARDLPIVRAPHWLSPRTLGSGPDVAKPFADLALAATLVRAHRRRRFDCVLAHNAEAALAALAARPLLRRPVVYMVHTLWRHELASYAPAPLARRLEGPLARVGAGLDALLARRCDAIVALGPAAERALSPHARGPITVIAPALAPGPDPTPDSVAAACARYGLEAGRFALYAGNLDGYQELALLVDVARRTRAPIVVVTHAAGAPPAPLRTARVTDATEARLLTYGAGVAVLPRRAPGGFPVKLLNYLEARRAVVARHGVAEGLAHDASAWLLDDDAPPGAWAGAIDALLADPARAVRLGAAGRAVLELSHDPDAAARRTLALLATLRSRHRAAEPR